MCRKMKNHERRDRVANYTALLPQLPHYCVFAPIVGVFLSPHEGYFFLS